MVPFECYVSTSKSITIPKLICLPLFVIYQVHVNAVMWRVVYRELRALTNDSAMNLDPMELCEIYEHVWNVATLLQSDECLSILDEGYRPWPKVIPSILP